MGQNRLCKNAPIIPTHLFFLPFKCFSTKLMCVCVNSRNYLWSINSVNQCDRHMSIIIRHLVFQTWGSKSWLFRHEGLNLMCLVLFNLVRGHDLLILFKYYTEIGLQSATVFGIGIRLYNFGANEYSCKLPIPGEAKAKAMPGRLYIHTRHK